MKLTVLLFLLCCTLVHIIFIRAGTIEKAVHDVTDEDDEDDEYGFGKDSGSKKILGVLWESCMRGRRHVYKVIDKYLKKEDLDKKLLEVAKIIGKRFEKRMEYVAKHLDEVFNYETSESIKT
ncbi:unnamed protein product [Heterobilharzia americana]|nr:unnamed protein product [Heterobilharzia americana]